MKKILLLGLTSLLFTLSGCGEKNKAEDATKEYSSSKMAGCSLAGTREVSQGYIVLWYCGSNKVEYSVNKKFNVVGMKTSSF